jgi:hypothetical protein
MVTPAAIIALLLSIIAIVALFATSRAVAKFTPREHEVSTIGIQSLMTGFTSWMFWSYGIWIWIAVTILMVSFMIREWYRFLKHDIREEPVSQPDPPSNPPANSN